MYQSRGGATTISIDVERGPVSCAFFIEVPNSRAMAIYHIEIVAWMSGRNTSSMEPGGVAKLSVSVNPYEEGDTWYRDMRTPGFNADELAPSSDNSVQWLGDGRLWPTRTLRGWQRSGSGGRPLWAARSRSHPKTRATADFEGLAARRQCPGGGGDASGPMDSSTGFQRSVKAYNLKDLLVEIVLSKWFRARRDRGCGPGSLRGAGRCRGQAAADAGGARTARPPPSRVFTWGRHTPRISRRASAGISASIVRMTFGSCTAASIRTG